MIAAITMTTMMIAKRKATLATDNIAITMTSVGKLVGETVEQPSGFKESITTGHVVSTWSCVEATVMGGVEATQEVRREDRSASDSAILESSARNTTV